MLTFTSIFIYLSCLLHQYYPTHLRIYSDTEATSPYAIHRHPGLPDTLNLLQTSIEELGLLLDNNTLTSVDLTKAYLYNIERDNHKGLNLRAIIQVAPSHSVLQIAHELDHERIGGDTRGLLHGIPILVKDNMGTDVELGMDTGAGNHALKESKAKRDAEVIKRLRDAGAIIVGKANMNEFAGWKARDLIDGGTITNGWSATGGQTSSAYVRGGFQMGGNPLGSSSGSAVGVSAGMAAGALGSDTTGSVISPAGRAALIGIRPSKGLVPMDGVVPLTVDDKIRVIDWNFGQAEKIRLDLETVGPIGFTTRDTAILLDVLTYNDGRYLNSTSPTDESNLKLGVLGAHFLDGTNGRKIRPETCVRTVEHALRSTMDHLEKAGGAEVQIVDADVTFDELLELERNIEQVMNMGMKEDLEVYLGGLASSPVRNLREVIEWNEARAILELPPDECCQQRLIDTLLSPNRSSPEYTQAWGVIHHLAGDKILDYLFNTYNFDALVFSPDLGYSSNFCAAMGYVVGTAPMGYCDNGAPFGIMFVVRPGQEEKLFGILAAYEAMRPKRRAPSLMSKL